MKKALVLMMITGLVCGSIATAEAGKKKAPKRVERKAEGDYTTTIVSPVGFCTQTGATNCVEIPSGPGEQFITAKVTDAHGQPVGVAVKGDADGDGSTETAYGTFCGETEEPIQIDAGVPVTFWVGKNASTATIPCAMGTSGKIEVTFSNLP